MALDTLYFNPDSGTLQYYVLERIELLKERKCLDSGLAGFTINGGSLSQATESEADTRCSQARRPEGKRMSAMSFDSTYQCRENFSHLWYLTLKD
jgi:hypothetical protein